LFCLLLLAGCNGDGYPEDLTYPVRIDPIFFSQDFPPDTPSAFDKPGELFTRFEDPANPLYEFKPDKKNYALLFPGEDPRTQKTGLSDDDETKLDNALTELYGTPSQPTVNLPKRTRQLLQRDKVKFKLLKLDDETLARGSKAYRLHCLHCHGLTGDGRGPTAPWVNPHPRDYRQGIFKFISSQAPESDFLPNSRALSRRKPRRADLFRTLHEGIEGTSMPSFTLHPQEELEDLVSYVIHLSLRGETELLLIHRHLAEKKIKNFTAAAVATQRELIRFWVYAEEHPITPTKENYPRYPEKTGEPLLVTQPPDKEKEPEKEEALKKSVQNGFKLFKACLSCHVDYGRQSGFKYDLWGTVVRPANLTLGVYRGGRRPVDLFYRLYGGIDGVNMPQYSPTREENRESEIWDIVNFLQVLPYPAMRERYGINIK
jgi:mono/diheme cytochrome c family protein